ncbi:MAG: hypothetical protein AAF222_02610 [Pseudomonadota bacterium]
MKELRQQLDLDLDELRRGAGPGAVRNVQSSVMTSDGEHTLQLKTKPNSKHLTIKTAGGEVLFDGELPEGGQIKGLPEDVQEKVNRMLNNARIEFRGLPELEEQPEAAPDRRNQVS